MRTITTVDGIPIYTSAWDGVADFTHGMTLGIMILGITVMVGGMAVGIIHGITADGIHLGIMVGIVHGITAGGMILGITEDIGEEATLTASTMDITAALRITELGDMLLLTDEVQPPVREEPRQWRMFRVEEPAVVPVVP